MVYLQNWMTLVERRASPHRPLRWMAALKCLGWNVLVASENEVFRENVTG